MHDIRILMPWNSTLTYLLHGAGFPPIVRPICS